jgi:heat shock protein HslJ
MPNRLPGLAAMLLLSLLPIAVTACSAAGSPLEGTQWRLAGWSVSSLYAGDWAITAKFSGGRVSGFSGVNTYSGRFTAGPADALSAGPLATTLMAGPEPAMRAEQIFTSLLTQATAYKISGSTLTLYSGHAESLIFQATGTAGASGG